MKRRLSRVLTVILLLVFVGSGVRLGVLWIQSRQSEQANEEALRLAGLTAAPTVSAAPTPTAAPIPTPAATAQPLAPAGEVTPEPAPDVTPEPDPHAEALRGLDLTALQQVNSDVIGWISIPDTELSYPLVQGADNDFYLKHRWDRGSGSAGAIFLDARDSAGLTDAHTIIYGHRMNNGSMFACLHDYAAEGFWQEHPSVYIATADGVRRYDIFAAYEADVFGHTYENDRESQEEAAEFVRLSLEQSVIDTGVEPQPEEPVITLSTCVRGGRYTTRWVIQAVLRAETSA